MNARVDYTVPLSERLLRNVEFDTNGGCWLWTGGVDNAQRGKIMSRSGVQEVAARVSYEVFVGPLGAGHYACHRCDVPTCINPAHLFSGTARDNSRDMVAKGRRPTPDMPKGNEHFASKVSASQVAIIRHLLKRFGSRKIAKFFPVNASAIDSIIAGKSWAHAPERPLLPEEIADHDRIAALIEPLPTRDKLTRAQADEIRTLYVPRHPLYGQGPLAKRFGVSRPLISLVVTRKVWA